MVYITRIHYNGLGPVSVDITRKGSVEEAADLLAAVAGMNAWDDRVVVLGENTLAVYAGKDIISYYTISEQVRVSSTMPAHVRGGDDKEERLVFGMPGG